jgi:hypothetical protein
MMANQRLTTFTSVLLATLTGSFAQAAVVQQDNFEKFSLEGFKHAGNGRSSVVNAPRAGNFAARLEIGPGDRRSELVIEGAKEVANGKDTWFGFSNRIDESWKFGKRRDIVFNVHKRREAGDAHGGQPLSLSIKNGKWVLRVLGDANRNSTLKSTKFARFDLGPVEKGRWNDWVFRYKPSFNDDGEVEVWKDGQKVLTHKALTLSTTADQGLQSLAFIGLDAAPPRANASLTSMKLRWATRPQGLKMFLLKVYLRCPNQMSIAQALFYSKALSLGSCADRV